MFSSTFIISPFIALLNQTLMVFMVRNVEHNSHILLMTGYEVRSCLLFSVCCCIGSMLDPVIDMFTCFTCWHRRSWGIFEGGPTISFCQNSILFCQNNILSGGANFSNSVLPSWWAMLLCHTVLPSLKIGQKLLNNGQKIGKNGRKLGK